MKRMTHKAIPAISVLLIAASPAWASSQAHPRGQDARPANAHVQTTTVERQVTQRDMRVSNLLGKDVQDVNARSIGQVKDLVIDTRDGRVSHVVLSAGGFLGIGDKLTAIPADAIAGVVDNGKLVLDMPKSRLQSYPQFDSDQWPDWNARGHGLEAASDRSNDEGQARAAARYRRASQLLDAKVTTPDGKDLGQIDDMVVGLGDGRVRYGVARFDRGLMKGDKRVVVPVDAVHPDGNGNLVVAASRDELQAAPAFRQSQWPDANDERSRNAKDRYATNQPSSAADRAQEPEGR